MYHKNSAVPISQKRPFQIFQLASGRLLVGTFRNPVKTKKEARWLPSLFAIGLVRPKAQKLYFPFLIAEL